jgi:hypothetical protein
MFEALFIAALARMRDRMTEKLQPILRDVRRVKRRE